MLNIDMTQIAYWVLDLFKDTIETIVNLLSSFEIGNFNIFQLLITIILLGALIPIIITIPHNLRSKGERKK